MNQEPDWKLTAHTLKEQNDKIVVELKELREVHAKLATEVVTLRRNNERLTKTARNALDKCKKIEGKFLAQDRIIADLQTQLAGK